MRPSATIGEACPSPTSTLQRRVSSAGQRSGISNPSTAPSLCGPRHCGQSPATLPDRERRTTIAGIATRHYTSTEGKKLIAPKLEKALGSIKTPEVRSGIIYALAYVGSKETTVPILRDLVKKAKEDYSKRFIRAAIAILEGKGGGFGKSTYWLFAEDRSDPARDDD